ncbi:hypothetical protein [Bartonella senegalensis]|uniref:hypothetical protein n=1 Tax=Bartonella senegalensis TaxID=1468418 RepID=UPI00030411E1|nr:hypothetical protein [Bartonella senegalensis]
MPTLSVAVDGEYNPHSHVFACLCGIIPSISLNLEEEKQHLQEGSDGKVHVSFNGIFTPPEEAAVYAVQNAKDQKARVFQKKPRD